MHHEHTSGLRNVWLENGYTVGAGGAVRYEDPDGLVHAIERELCLSPHRLSPAAVHFLRRVLEMTQLALDAVLELEPGTVAACEEGFDELPEDRSRLLRLLVMQAAEPAALLCDVPEQALAPAQKLIFRHVGGRWRCVERVTLPALLSPNGHARPARHAGLGGPSR